MHLERALKRWPSVDKVELRVRKVVLSPSDRTLPEELVLNSQSPPALLEFSYR
jgi:hypothetical protein